ncbi:MAG: CHAT domain-containing protein [Saprospiraceae bacterium]
MSSNHVRYIYIILITWGVCLFKLPISFSQTPTESIGIQNLNLAKKLSEENKINASNEKALLAIDFFYKNNNWESWANAYIQIYDNARLSDTPKDLTWANSKFEIAERNIKENSDISNEAIADIFSRIAYLQQNLGQYGEAITYYQKTFSYAEETKDELFLCKLYGSAGVAYWMIGDDKRSINYNEKALRLAHNLEIDWLIIHITNSLADAWRTVDIQKSIPLYQQSLELDPNNSETHMLLSKAIIESEGDANQALVSAQKGWEYADNDFAKSDALHQLGRVYHYKGNYLNSIKYYNNALPYAEKSYGESNPEYIKIFYFIGNTYLENQEIDQALLNYNKVLDNLLSLFTPTSIEDFPKKEDFTNTSLWILEALIGKCKAFQKKYLISNNKKDLERALSAAELGIYYLQKIKLRYSEDDSKYYLSDNYYSTIGDAMEIAFQLEEIDPGNQYWENAFQLCAQSKAIVLAETLYRKELKNLSGVPNSFLNQEKKIYNQIAYWEKKISETVDLEKIDTKKDSLFLAKSALEKLEQKIEDSFPEFAKAKFDYNLTRNVASVQKEIPDSSLLIEYFISDNFMYTFLIDQDTFWTNVQEYDPSFDKNIKSFIRSISDWNFVEDSSAYASQLFLESSHWIYKKVLSENLSEDTYKNLIIVPDQLLSLIPFEALLSESFEGTWIDRDIPFLIKDYSISYRFSSIFYPKNPNRNLDNWGGFGVEFNDQNELDYLTNNYEGLALRNNGQLPFAGDEINTIGEFFDGNIWLNKDATRENFIENAEEYDILHLATHAVIDKKDPLKSKIIFANSIIDDNPVVYAHEIYSLQLNAGLTVLSACSSGTGSYKRGEGIMSLARAFTFAGCPSVVMSLWNVSDQATSNLMTDFYQNLKQGSTKDEALRQSKLSYLNSTTSEYTKPIYWASFVAVGDMNPMLISDSSSFPFWKILLSIFLIAFLGYFIISRIR